MHTNSVEAFIHLTHACIWATKHQRQRGACARHVSFNWDTSSVPIHFTSMKRVWVTDTKSLSHRQKGLVNDQGRNMHSFVNKLRLEVNLSMIGRWTQLWRTSACWGPLKTQNFVDDWEMNSILTNQQLIGNCWRLRKMSMIGTGLNVENSATHWSPLKTEENVHDWDLDSPLRNQQLLDDTASFWAPSYRLWAAPSQSSALALVWAPSMDQYLYGQRQHCGIHV